MKTKFHEEGRAGEYLKEDLFISKLAKDGKKIQELMVISCLNATGSNSFAFKYS